MTKGREGPARLVERLTAIVLVALAVTGTSCASTSGKRATADNPSIESSKTLGTTHGPNGEKATPTSALELSSREVARVQAGRYTASFVWHEASDFTTAVTAGVNAEFERLGIKVTAETSANFDAAKQKADIETVQAKKPSVLLTLPVDAVVTASAYKAAARQGTKIVLLSIVPQGMEYGRDYVNVVTDDLFQMGKRAADALARGDVETLANWNAKSPAKRRTFSPASATRGKPSASPKSARVRARL